MVAARAHLTARLPTHTLETSEEAGVRFLHFGSEWVQGAMRIARPYTLELEYTREMAACLLLRPDADWPQRSPHLWACGQFQQRRTATDFWQVGPVDQLPETLLEARPLFDGPFARTGGVQVV